MTEPTGRPIPGVSNADDARWALDKVRRYIFLRGGEWTPSLHEHVDRWLAVMRAAP